ncbi:hypothetical protein ACLB2K_028849 [Fragaria x ananassa]
MDQIQIDADSHNNLPPMTLDHPESQDSEEIKIDQDSVSDCESESVPENLFGAFTDNEMMKRVVGIERDAIVKSFVSGMGEAGKETRVVALHRNLSSGLTRKARLDAFRVFTEAVARKCGGNPNIRYGCYGGTKDEIAEILVHGFSARNEAVRGRVHLVPVKFAVDAAAASGVDEDGMRHVLICRVIMGKSELMPAGFNRNGPFSSEFDSGVDSMLDPRKYIVWSASMNSHICPVYVVSFKAPGCLNKYAAPPQKAVSFVDLLPVLARSLEPEKMAVLYKLRDDYWAKKISLADLHRKVMREVDNKVMDSAMKLVKSRQGGADPSPAPGTVNFSGFMKVLSRFLPASKMDVLAKLLHDYRENRISLAELNREVRLVVDNKVMAAAIKLTKPNRCALLESALARLLPPSQWKILAGLIKDFNAKKISRSEFGQKFKLIVDNKMLDSAIKLATQSSQQRSITASDVRLKVPNSSIYFTDLMPFLERSLSPQKMALLTKSLEDFKAEKISRAQQKKCSRRTFIAALPMNTECNRSTLNAALQTNPPFADEEAVSMEAELHMLHKRLGLGRLYNFCQQMALANNTVHHQTGVSF